MTRFFLCNTLPYPRRWSDRSESGLG